jgi:colanic acid biosynthesis glycosyl transferase WcaI
MPTRVLIMTQWFDPEPTLKGLEFARSLVRRGFEVDVVTGFPNYPGGKVYPGYRVRLIQREEHDGVRVSRVPLYPSHGSSGVGRALNYVSFAACAFVYALLLTRRPSVIYAYHPPLTVGIAAGLVGMLRRVPVVYDIQDMWPDTLRATGMISNGRLLSLIGRCCDWVYRRMARIVVLSPGFKTLLVERGVPASRVEVVFNWADEAALKPVPRAGRSREGSAFRVYFAGNMGKAQALGAVLDAARLVQPEAPAVEFVFIGGGVEVSNLAASASGQSNVRFLEPVPMSRVAEVLADADLLLVHLRRDPLFEITVPSKTQAYLLMGKPVLMAVGGDAANLIEASGAGVTAIPEDPRSIADAVLRVARLDPETRAEIGERGAQFYRSHLSFDAGTTRFADILESAARGGSRHATGVL